MSNIRTHTTHATRTRPRPTDTGEIIQAIGNVTSQQRSLQAQLQAINAAPGDRSVAAKKISQLAAALIKASFFSYVRPSESTPLEAIATIGSIDSAPSLNFTSLQEFCLQAIKQNKVVNHTISATDQRAIVVMPVQADGRATGAVVALLEITATPITERMLIMDLVSYALQQWDTQRAIEHLDWEARTASAITELIGKVETSSSHDYACLLSANTLNEHFGTRLSAIGLVGKGASIRIQSISGKAEFDAQSVLVQQLAAAMDETLIRDDVSTWPPLEEDDRHAMINHRKLAEAQNEHAVISVPLKTVDGTILGVWLSAGSRTAIHDERQANALKTVAPYLATSLQVRKEADPGLIGGAVRKVLGRDAAVGRWTLISAVVLLCLLPMLPVQHRIKSYATVEPVQQRFVTVPFDGVLKETFVRPGDRVTQGQLIAVMDDRELGWKLGGLVADAGIAGKKQDVAMASHDIHEAQMAALEKESLAQQIQVLQHRKQNLEITAALDGFILKGDLEEAHGAPVKIGQSLFEIAPLAPLKLEVAIPEDEIAYVQEGMTVNARLDGHPQDTITGTIDTLHPRSEIRDNRNVFIGEILLDNEEQQLRPGMNGRARVMGKRKMLGWIWLHKAVHRVRSAIGV